jgi:hypothetical protein
VGKKEKGRRIEERRGEGKWRAENGKFEFERAVT